MPLIWTQGNCAYCPKRDVRVTDFVEYVDTKIDKPVIVQVCVQCRARLVSLSSSWFNDEESAEIVADMEIGADDDNEGEDNA